MGGSRFEIFSMEERIKVAVTHQELSELYRLGQLSPRALEGLPGDGNIGPASVGKSTEASCRGRPASGLGFLIPEGAVSPLPS